MNKIFSWFIDPMIAVVNEFSPAVLIVLMIVLSLCSLDAFMEYGMMGIAMVFITELVTLWFAGVLFGMFERSDRP